jgi:hypothetical protein
VIRNSIRALQKVAAAAGSLPGRWLRRPASLCVRLVTLVPSRTRNVRHSALAYKCLSVLAAFLFAPRTWASLAEVQSRCKAGVPGGGGRVRRGGGGQVCSIRCKSGVNQVYPAVGGCLTQRGQKYWKGPKPGRLRRGGSSLAYTFAKAQEGRNRLGGSAGSSDVRFDSHGRTGRVTVFEGDRREEGG